MRRWGRALLFVLACLFLVVEPWHGAVVLSLSERHGIDAGDLPGLLLIALALALAPTQPRDVHRFGAALAVVVGALLITRVADPKIGSPLVPAGGGTFDGSTQQADGQAEEPVDHWSDLTLTYDGAALRLYVDGVRVSSLATTGRILQTSDPLWIGGNRPYGEYFHGAIDEVRVYDRALSPTAVRAAMSAPVGRRAGSPATGLVAAYSFDAGSGRTVTDASGHGNDGSINGAKWARIGRFGSSVSFDGAGQFVRVPASASLDLGSAMTLAAWIRPSEPQSGWRTVLARQRDAYFLMAGGGREHAVRVRTVDEARFALLIALAVAICVLLAGGRASWNADGRRPFWPPVVLFVAGAVVDVALEPAATLIGPAAVAAWYAVTATHRDESAGAFALTVLFACVTVLSLVDPDVLQVAHDDGGVARTTALGLLLVTEGLLSARHASLGG